MTERKWGTVKKRGRRGFLVLTLHVFVLSAIVSPGQPLAESTFEVIMDLLVNAPLQVDLPRPLQMRSLSKSAEETNPSSGCPSLRFFCPVCQVHLLNPHSIYWLPLSHAITFTSICSPAIHFALSSLHSSINTLIYLTECSCNWIHLFEFEFTVSFSSL